MSWILAGALLVSPLALRAQEGRPGVADTLTLGAAIEGALQHDAGVASARAAVSGAGADRLAAWGAFLPTADASTSFYRYSFTTVTYVSPEGLSQRVDQPITDIRRSATQDLAFSWDLLRGGRRFASLGATAAETRAAGLRVGDAERTAVSTVKQAYFDALLRQRLADMAAGQLGARRQDLEVTRRRYQIAAADRSDLLGAQIHVRQAELALSDARGAARDAVRQLEVAMGEPGDVPDCIALGAVAPLPNADSLDADALVRRALGEDPALLAFRADADAAGSRMWSARSQYLPTISVGFDLARSEQLGANGNFFTFNPSNHSNSFFLMARWSLFNGFTRHQQAAQAAVAQNQALASHARKSHEIERDVRNLVAEVKRRQRRMELERQVADLSRQRVELAREQFRLGTLNFIELQSVIDQATSSEQAVAQELHDSRVAWAKLEALVGVGS
jgi:multidrug efflux system outer membrane protein